MSAEPPKEGSYENGYTHTDIDGSWTFENGAWYNDNSLGGTNFLPEIVIEANRSIDWSSVARKSDNWHTKAVNFLSGGAIDEARAMLDFKATNLSFGEKIMFRTGIALQNSTAETFGAKSLGAWGNYGGELTNHLNKNFSVKTANGIKIRGFTKHAIHRSIQRNVRTIGVLDAVKNPIKINNVVIDNLGRYSQTFVGVKGTVVVNPQTGQIISVYPIFSKRVKKYSK